MRLAIVGCGHVGLVAAGCLTAIGHEVRCADQDAGLVSELEAIRLPLYEPFLLEAIRQGRSSGRLTFTTDAPEAARSAEAIFLCVGAPQLDNGNVDLSALDGAARRIAVAVDSSKLVVVGSTVPVRTSRQLRHLLAVYGNKSEDQVFVAANPQFLREGSALEDFFHPGRVLIGVAEARSEALLRQIYAPILEQNFPCPLHPGSCPTGRRPELLVTNLQSAELIKYVANAFLGLKISYANVLADICERLGGDIQEVTRAIGLDPRIGSKFLEAGLGFGGPRLPKDLRTFLKLLENSGVEAGILQAADRVNQERVDAFFQKIERLLWVLNEKRVALLGLAYTPNTDDVRGSPAMQLWKRLTSAGAHVSAYDPQAMANARAAHPAMACVADAYQAAEGADALVIATAWEDFRSLDWQRIRDSMARPAILDGRNVLSPSRMKGLGFEYQSVGKANS